MSTEQKEIIQYHIDNKMLLNIERNHIIGTNNIEGFPIKLENGFLLTTVISDFHDEGYAIIILDDITDAYSNQSVEFYENICEKEGLKEKIDSCIVDKIDNMRQILEQLQKYEGFVIIQCEKEQTKCNFFMGTIFRMSDEFVEIQSFGMDGKMDKKLDCILFENITMVAWGDNYSKTFYKYRLKECME